MDYLTLQLGTVAPVRTPKRTFPIKPKPLKKLKDPSKATVFSNKNRRRDETDEQFKEREAERKRRLRQEGRA